MKNLANIISYIFHPVYMPTLGMYIILNHAFFHVSNPGYVWFACLVVFVFTCLLPVFTIFTLKMLKLVSSVHLPTRQERRIPLLASAAFFLLAYYLIKSVEISGVEIINFIMASGVTTMLALTFVNYFYKLSIHMAAIGSLTALLISIPNPSSPVYNYFVYGAVLASGLVGFARLELKAHSTGEVTVGYLTGFFSQFLMLHLFLFLNA